MRLPKERIFYRMRDRDGIYVHNWRRFAQLDDCIIDLRGHRFLTHRAFQIEKEHANRRNS